MKKSQARHPNPRTAERPARWKAKVAASKFVDYPGYGQATVGLIGIQGDHDGTLAIRNIRIRRLP